MTKSQFHEGLSGRTSIGRAGRYSSGMGMDTFQLATILWRGLEFTKAGRDQTPLFSPELPDRYSFKKEHLSWTGMALRYGWPGGGVTIELRSTLPGPLFVSDSRELKIRWAFRNAPAIFQSLDKGYTSRIGTDIPARNSRLFLCGNRVMPTLIVCSSPIIRITALSWEHWTITTKDSRARVLIVPLLDKEDTPRTAARRDLWQKLIARPPIDCSEGFVEEKNAIRIIQTFDNTFLSPLPPVAVIAGSMNGLQKLPPHTILCKTLLGPYAVVKGNTAVTQVSMTWSQVTAVPTRPVTGKLAPVPEELAYAGDVSWDPDTPMDQLLSLRIWARLLKVMPEVLRTKILKQVAVPEVSAFKKSLRILKEPVSGRLWAKEAALFDEWGDVSYDSDWYNGLTLSGLAQATEASEPYLAAAAQKLARSCKKERHLLSSYYSLFCDWPIQMAWVDPRGETWNLDCAHNGLEGILAESRLCRHEGDLEQASFMRYLAAKGAVALMAGYPLATWCRNLSFTDDEYLGTGIGIRHIYEGRGAGLDLVSSKTCYSLPGFFPEMSNLIRLHGPVAAWQEFCRLWEKNHNARYRDWIHFYTGMKSPGGKVAKRSLKQEKRIQAAVFYHLSPEICLRLWTLEQKPDRVEKLFSTPLNLAEELLCRAGFVLVSR